MFDYLAGTSVRVFFDLLTLIFLFYKLFNKWKKLSIGIDFGIGFDQNSWYRTGIVSEPKKLVSPITKGALKDYHF
jgi:hypothetical protein